MTEIVNGEVRSQDKPVQTKPIQLAHIRTKPYYIRKGKKKSRRYSRGNKAQQQSMRSQNRMFSRLTQAIADGVKMYEKRSDRSARKKKDGMLKDSGKNAAKAMSKVIRKSSKLPKDLMKVISPKASRKQSRKIGRIFMFR